ncbi:uncharacterized protein LACBIDRAFT_302434 [Laccaria bicolor S238N-H82]|uniref:Predicted protein n=1 Tax=Laccaria bicolor (strain S238N-H82 / ATCC MYA-4686) TaxID=486041 RepID=B0DHM8_LACBS|nr:uncharacterized protein LACBIDRAFT_302434 [Laccaria bicolor S238N-H82]EDR05860.1 predicted protein [Laccaria bicolor S238N-H82]|eukprot:XP_001883536.1 predicted protein [Laccaria bicolor S238N-H82]
MVAPKESWEVCAQGTQISPDFAPLSTQSSPKHLRMVECKGQCLYRRFLN